MSKIASTISLLVGDIGNFGSDTNAPEDYKLTATTCAMQYAFENNV
ncbi:MAG: hypothetical protein SPLUMA1_SPLUMAMAG1_01541 [uncultured Sulfurimonas sp.]|nr:MAG: hypothetical protein SPLUMA1_SPLUMAMAG1_01541 [uncultured Sulfurimonas sp.]